MANPDSNGIGDYSRFEQAMMSQAQHALRVQRRKDAEAALMAKVAETRALVANGLGPEKPAIPLMQFSQAFRDLQDEHNREHMKVRRAIPDDPGAAAFALQMGLPKRDPLVRASMEATVNGDWLDPDGKGK